MEQERTIYTHYLDKLFFFRHLQSNVKAKMLKEEILRKLLIHRNMTYKIR